MCECSCVWQFAHCAEYLVVLIYLRGPNLYKVLSSEATMMATTSFTRKCQSCQLATKLRKSLVLETSPLPMTKLTFQTSTFAWRNVNRASTVTTKPTEKMHLIERFVFELFHIWQDSISTQSITTDRVRTKHRFFVASSSEFWLVHFEVRFFGKLEYKRSDKK